MFLLSARLTTALTCICLLSVTSVVAQEDGSGVLGKTLPVPQVQLPGEAAEFGNDGAGFASGVAEQPSRDKLEDLSGRWVMTMPAGWVHQIELTPKGNNTYRLETVPKNAGFVLAGTYQFAGLDLKMQEPGDDRMQSLTWRRARAGTFSLIEEPQPFPTGASYRGCLLERPTTKDADSAEVEAAVEALPDGVLLVEIDKARTMRVRRGRERVRIVELTDLIEEVERGETQTVELNVDPTVPYQVVVKALDVMNASDVEGLRFKFHAADAKPAE